MLHLVLRENIPALMGTYLGSELKHLYQDEMHKQRWWCTGLRYWQDCAWHH